MKPFILCAVLVLFHSFCWGIIVPNSDYEIKESGNMVSDFVRVDPEDGHPEKLPTKAWVWQDDDCLIVHYEATIDSTFTQGFFTTRDTEVRADMLRVQLVTVPESYFAYYYCAYPLGNLLDGIRNSDMSVSYDWDSSYSYESTYTSDLWTVTMRIPLSELRFKNQLPYRWGIILTRLHEHNREFYSSPDAVTRLKLGYFQATHPLELNHPVARKLNLTLRPYYVKSYDMISKTDSFDPDHVGLDVVFAPSQRTRIKIAMNPDFSDVPPDDAQDNYNSKYPPWLDENRFFFIEDIDVFSLDSSAFQSRVIAKPQFAYKITGNSQSLKWGILGALDKKITDDGFLVNDDNYYQIIAFNPKWERLSLSNYIVSICNDDYYNHLYSGEYSWEVLKDTYLNSSLWGSIRDRDDQFSKGYLASGSICYNPPNWSNSIYGTIISKDMSADGGYMYDNDYSKCGFSFNLNSDYSQSSIRNYGSSLWGEMFYFNRDDGVLNNNSFGASAYLNTKNLVNLYLNGGISREADLDDKNHDLYNANLILGWYKKNLLQPGFSIFQGKSIIYSLGESHRQNSFTIRLNGNPTPTISYGLHWMHKHYNYPKENLIGIGDNAYIVKLDNEYDIINGSLSYTASSSLRIKSGLGISTYENSGIYSNLNFYTNLRYEFRRECFAYLGFQTTQIQDEESDFGDPIGHFVKQAASAYLKISLRI